ncbi:hypothetical protein HPB51_020690 [Rhipicephalus microplus]|uniref:Uncharacterized protein n=1 Tax=Rhipicephalus microplus TaxID=6941 RepID=A0A9J6EVA4_RHIMP|nr:hypothetical protein HPB51_020690 [Rhipicephalus microplus]
MEMLCSGRATADVILRAGLEILNTGEFTFVRKGVRTAIDISVATDHCACTWSNSPDTWGSDHLPIFLNTNTVPSLRSRVSCTVNSGIFQRLSGTPLESDFMQHAIASAKAATVVSKTKPGRPVPDLKQLQLWATRRKPELHAIRSSTAEDWTAFRRQSAVCRRHANRQWKQSWEGVCSTISSRRRSSTAWWLLRSLQHGRAIRHFILAVDISLDITEVALVDLMPSNFATRLPGLPADARL